MDETEAAIIGWKDLFHQNPEISLREEHTSGKIVEIIEELGLSWERVGEYGIIAYLPGKKPGKTVLLRADMDALPVDESEMNLKGRKKCCSLKKSVSHACGHDAHMAMMLGAMRVLYQIREELEGNVIFAFEQAEEVGKGIDPMMAALEKYAIDTCFGIHVFAELEEGKISVQSGPRMAALTAFTVKVIGKGGHASRPDLTVNPLMCAANILVNLNTIWSQELDSTKVVTLGIAMMHCGKKAMWLLILPSFPVPFAIRMWRRGRKRFRRFRESVNMWPKPTDVLWSIRRFLRVPIWFSMTAVVPRSRKMESRRYGVGTIWPSALCGLPLKACPSTRKNIREYSRFSA